MFGFFPVDVGFGGVSPDRASLTASKAFCSSCLRRILTCRFTRCLTSPWNLLRLAAFFRCCSFSSSSTRNAEAWERWKQISPGFCYTVASEQFVSLYPLFPHLERPGRQAAPRANFMFCFKICGVTAWTISTGLLWAGLSLTSDTEHAHLCLGLSATHREGKKKEAHGAAPSSCSHERMLKHPKPRSKRNRPAPHPVNVLQGWKHIREAQSTALLRNVFTI